MKEQDKRHSRPKGLSIELEEKAAGPFRPRAPCSSIAPLMICLLYICSPGQSQMPASVNYCSGQQYSFQNTITTPCNDDFYYLWNASAGRGTDIDNCTFIWTAPEVTAPTEVTISLLVSNKYLFSCNSRDEIRITVYPRPAVSLSPAAVEVCRGQNAVLIANTTGTVCAGQLIYRWYRGSTLIDGATSSSYDASESGNYRVEVACSSTGCSNSASSRVTVRECGPLTIACPADIWVCNDSGENFATIADLGTPRASDPQAAVANDAPANNQYPMGMTTVTWTATDAAGNNASCDQMITVRDCRPLAISCPADLAVCNDPGEDFATIADLGTPRASDPQAAVANNAPANNQYPVGRTTVTWTATDAAGNNASCGQEIVVENCETPILELNKTALNDTVSPGQDIYYVIQLHNNGYFPRTNVVLWDVLPEGVTLVGVYPEPLSGSSLTWNVGTLAPDESFVVDLRVHLPIVDLRYNMSQGVSGEGFVNVHNNFDTSIGPKSIKNCAYAKADLVNTISSCAITPVINPGTELERRDSGSGSYASQELIRILAQNKSIQSATSLSDSYGPTTFFLPGNRSINYAIRWTEQSRGINTITGATMTEEYTFAGKIDKNSTIELDSNGSTMKTEVEFEGVGHIGVLKKESPDAHPSTRPAYEASEEYVGGFRVLESADDYGSNVKSERNVSGYGYVAAEKRVGDRQRTYESGTGSYSIEEIIDTPASYMAKDISLTYGPANFSYTPRFNLSRGMLWSEGMWSQRGILRGGDIFKKSSQCGLPVMKESNSTPPASYLSERFSSLDYMKKESIASGLNEVKSNVSFSGMADFEVRSIGKNRGTEVDNQERYAGKYDIKRHVLLTGGSKYDKPHLTVIKRGHTRSEWYNEAPATLADYNITITNDGTSSLAPVYVQDAFPPGTQYIRSTIRPTSIGSGHANWTLFHLGIGDSITIGLTLNVTDDAPVNMVNRVQVCGNYSNSSVCAGNYSWMGHSGLGCCPGKVQVSKSAWLDDKEANLVHYRIDVINNAPDSVAVTATDRLPGGMTLLNASISPNADSTDRIIWALPEIGPNESRSIEYLVRALGDGCYTNTVHIDATAINGTAYDIMDASAYIEINSISVTPMTYRYGDWEPPAWNLNSPEGESFEDLIDSSNSILEVVEEG